MLLLMGVFLLSLCSLHSNAHVPSIPSYNRGNLLIRYLFLKLLPESCVQGLVSSIDDPSHRFYYCHLLNIFVSGKVLDWKER